MSLVKYSDDLKINDGVLVKLARIFRAYNVSIKSDLFIGMSTAANIYIDNRFLLYFVNYIDSTNIEKLEKIKNASDVNDNERNFIKDFVDFITNQKISIFFGRHFISIQQDNKVLKDIKIYDYLGYLTPEKLLDI